MNHKTENVLLINELSSTLLFIKMFYNTVIKCFWIGHHTFQQKLFNWHQWQIRKSLLARPWVFLKYVFTLFSAENERSTDAVEYGMVRTKITNLCTSLKPPYRSFSCMYLWSSSMLFLRKSLWEYKTWSSDLKRKNSNQNLYISCKHWKLLSGKLFAKL